MGGPRPGTRHQSVFTDESKLDLNYIPDHLPHREEELRFLRLLFRFALENPEEMSQRVLITGPLGTGKTVLSQRLGLLLEDEAWRRGVRLRYVHVNCRELRGSLFLILRRVVKVLQPGFPGRGYSPDEALEALMERLEEEGCHLILCLDEVDALVEEEPEALYKLTRIQEARVGLPRRLSLICITRRPETLARLDPSTLSTLQRNILRLRGYTKDQLLDIVRERALLAFRPGAVSPQSLELISELAAEEGGDARYAIDLMWRAGKYADRSYSPLVLPEHVRRAAVDLFPALRREVLHSLTLHERLLLLAIARYFKSSEEAYARVGEVAETYRVICEEYGEEPRRTQLSRYLRTLGRAGIISTRPSGAGGRGRSTLISLKGVPAEDLEREVMRWLEGEGGWVTR
ncbi:ORC1-type DNA replication protein [Candidatus Bathyarchaeota archaeon]|nr:MAG: ORC1-type DNA replication protein [Candidatus Bathyarchaeota archaeon]